MDQQIKPKQQEEIIMKSVKKCSIISAILLIAILISGCTSTDYKNAVSFFNAGKYDEAEAIFTRIHDYKDSAIFLDKIEESKKPEYQFNDIPWGSTYKDTIGLLASTYNVSFSEPKYDTYSNMLLSNEYTDFIILSESPVKFGEYDAMLYLHYQYPNGKKVEYKASPDSAILTEASYYFKFSIGNKSTSSLVVYGLDKKVKVDNKTEQKLIEEIPKYLQNQYGQPDDTSWKGVLYKGKNGTSIEFESGSVDFLLWPIYGKYIHGEAYDKVSLIRLRYRTDQFD